MAAIKSINLLPEIFRTDVNKKFLAATVDQLVSEPDFRRVDGFIGRKFAPTYKSGDSYLEEPTSDRQNYQLEPSFVVQDASNNVLFYSSYLDLIQKIAHYGGITNDHSRLFENESYNFNGLFDFDKFVNFNQYYWLPDGPPEVTVSANQTTTNLSFNVVRDATRTAYTFTGYGTDPNPIITLIKGTTYRFNIGQTGNPFWIQTEPGATGTRSSEAEELSRTILGVTNNGDDNGTVIFRVPASNAQDSFRFAERVASVDYATSLTYTQIQNHLLTAIRNSGGIDGSVSRSLDGRTLIFLNQTMENDAWTDQGVFDYESFDQADAFTTYGFEAGDTVPGVDRFDIWRIRVLPVGTTNGLLRLERVQVVEKGKKVFITSGTSNAGVEYLKNSEGYWEPVQPLTAQLTELYYQDGNSNSYGGIIRLVEPDSAVIDVETDIIGRTNYTSPNGVKFTNGMKIRFDGTVTPVSYTNNVYIVEGVGKSIRLVSAGNLIVPEQYALDDNLSTPDYITVSRGSLDLNAWSRSNRWFHSELIDLAATYNNDPTIRETIATRASRPIIEFEPDLYLYNYGQLAKAPVEILDYSVTDAFKEVEGQESYVIQLPNNVSRPLTAGTRIIFAADTNPEVRNRIYRVDFITVAERTKIHLVSQNTELLPTYYVNGAQLVEDVSVAFVGGNPDRPAAATLSVDSITGEILDITFSDRGAGYRSKPEVTFVGGGIGSGAQIDIELLNGEIYNYRLITGGSGYSVAPVYGFVPTVTFSRPVPSIGAVQTTGSAIMRPTSVANVSVSYGGINYIADPHVKISTTSTSTAVVTPVYSAYKYVDYIRITNAGSGIGAASISIESPNSLEKFASYANSVVFTSNLVTLDSTSGVSAGQLVFANGVTGGTTVEAVVGSAVRLSSPAAVLDETKYVFKPSTSTVEVATAVYSNSVVFSTDIVSLSAVGTIATGWRVFGEGVPVGATVSTVFGNASVLMSSSILVKNGRQYTFKPDGVSTAVAVETVRFSTTLNVDSTSTASPDMYITGGQQPVNIVGVETDNPVVVTTENPHGLIDGDQIVIRGVNGTEELNNKTYWIKVVSLTQVRLYADDALQITLDGRNYTDYLDSGVLASYTIEYGVTVTKIIDENTLELSEAISIRAGTVVSFVGIRAAATVSADGTEVYAIKVTEHGAGYTTAPNITITAVGGTVTPTATAILNDDVIEYFKIVDAGSGYEIANNITTEVISSATATTIKEVTYGTRVLTFADSEEIRYIKEGWRAFLIVVDNLQPKYTDFGQIPYASTSITGPDPNNYRYYMDVGLSEATILTVVGIEQIEENLETQWQITLSGDINSLDSDGEIINLPSNSNIFFTAKSRYFTEDYTGDSAPAGEIKATYYTRLPVFDTTRVSLTSVEGLQHGMTVRVLSEALATSVIKVVSVDQVNRSITISQRINVDTGVPLSFSSVGAVTTNLNSTKIQSIQIENGGAEYTSAPTITIEPAIPAIVKVATSTGTARLQVNDLDGLEIGMSVNSEFSVAGDGVTTGSQVPRIIDLISVQTGTDTFDYFVDLNQTQPAFESLLLTFTLSAKALAQIQSLNVTQTITADETPDTYEADDTVIIALPTTGVSSLKQRQVGVNTFNQYWYDGTNWLPAQQKSKYNQAPLFDVFNKNGASASDTTVYQGSKFFGTKIFSYKTGTGSNDPQLGFPLSYRNFQNVGDIVFENNYDTESFAYLSNKIEVLNPINEFFFKQKTATGFKFRNIWSRATELTKQYQIITKFFDGDTNYFEIDIFPKVSATIPYIKVYVDNVLIDETQYQITTFQERKVIIIDADLLVDAPLSKVDILIYSDQVSSLGYYQIPTNIDLNTENTNFTSLTLGQLRQHLVTMSQNHYGLTGTVLGTNNLRDIDIKGWSGAVMQHAAPAMYSALFFGDQGLEFIEAAEFAQKEYTKFKNKFLDQAIRQEINVKNIPAAVDQLMNIVNVGRNTTMPWYDSDMVPYGTANTTTSIPILDIRQRRYQIPSIYHDTVPSRRSVLVYLIDDSIGLRQQLIKGIDFTFNQNISAIDIASTVTLSYTQRLDVIDRPSTVGSYVPETPTKLGLYPRFVPRIYTDNTYQVPTEVLIGHDGSITPTFGDYRDQLLLELELRIYNNIKVDYQNTLLDVIDSIPGKFRDTGYTRAEFNRLLTRNFLRWAGNNKIDYNDNTTFQGNNPWTWNYKYLKDASGENLPGFWRGIYQYYFDTDRPHTAPWEMLGFYEMPDWWTERYGPAPYTGTNSVLWDDLELGFIAGGVREGYDTRFARPGLSKIIPVDDTGTLKSPEKFAPKAFDSGRLSSGWAVGDQAPAETAWRRSSEYPYALQIAIALSRPAFYFGQMFNIVDYARDADIDQLILKDSKQRVTKYNFSIPDDGLVSGTVNLTAGYINWVRDWFTNKAINGTAKISQLIKNVEVKLSYKMAGYSDPKFLNVVADQSSPVSSSSSIVLPQENYKIFLNKSAPITRLTYSAVVIERSNTGYSVTGYDLEQPYFTIIPSKVNQNRFNITAINRTATVYRDFDPVKVTVPYGYEFDSIQQVVDFLVSYGRYLIGQGMVFDTFNSDMEVRQDWILSAREFMTWAQQGWSSGSLLILSPIYNVLKFNNSAGIIDQVGTSITGSRVLDQNFNIIKPSQYTIIRDENAFSLTSIFGQTIALASLNVVQYEHVLLMDNSTVFGDVVYQPELGNRQYRLRLIGNKTGNWTGQLNPAGFIYNSDAIDEWISGRNYRKGSLVSYKEKYYYAISDVTASEEFNFADWSQVDKNNIKTGLLPNFAYNAEKFNNIYDIDNRPTDTTFNLLGQGVTGYRDRSYFQDFDLDLTSQAKFYQGFIKQKGTINSIDALTTAQFRNLSSSITLYEEWALRIGDYGAIGSDQSIEFELNEQDFADNPSTLLLINRDETPTEGYINVDPGALYRTSEDTFNRNPIINRDDIKARVGDAVTAGYPRLDDVDATLFDITDFQNNYTLVDRIGAGFKIWVAKDFNKSWNVYRANETDVLVDEIQIGLDSQITIVCNKPHNVAVDQLIVIKNFDPDYNGFYKVLSVAGSSTFKVLGYRNLQRLRSAQSITGVGILLTLSSVRFDRVNDLVTTTPIKGWRSADKVWIDNDTATDQWAVFEKSQGWQFDKLLPLRDGDARTNEGYGEALKINNNNTLVLAGAKDSTPGSITTVRVLYPGFLYKVADGEFSPPNLSALSGQTAIADFNESSGTLLYGRTNTSGSGYQLTPNVEVYDTSTGTVNGSVINSNVVTLSSLTVSVNKTPLTNANESKSLTLNSVNDLWVGDTVFGNDGTGNTIPVTVLVANINYATNVITLTSNVTWSNVNTQTLAFTHSRVYVNDTVTGSDGFGNTISTTVKEVGTGSSSVVLNSNISYRSGGTLTFTRGTGGNVQARLTPTTLANIVVINGGGGFTTNPIIELIGGDGSGAAGYVTLDQNGAIDEVILTSAGSGYTYPPTVNLITTNVNNGAILEARLTPSTVKDFVVAGEGRDYRHPRLLVSTHTNDNTGTGASGNVNVTNQSITSVTIRAYGLGYTAAPSVTVTDTSNDATGAGVELDVIFSTGLVKAFQYGEGTFTQIQNVPSFGPDASEFGYTLDIGYDVAVVGAPGSFDSKGAVSIAQNGGTVWQPTQVLHPLELNPEDRYGHALATTKDQRWLYVGAPGANRVYVYARKLTPTNSQKIAVVPGEFSYLTNFVLVKTNAEVKVVGGSGKKYEPGFDYVVVAGSLTFTNFETIASETAIYVSQLYPTTVIVPTTIRGVLQTSYVLNTTPIEIDQLSVVGADGRVYIKGLDYNIAGVTLTFLTKEFAGQASVSVIVLNAYYVLVDTLEPSGQVLWENGYSASDYDRIPLAGTVDTYADMEAGTWTTNDLIKVLNKQANGTFDDFEIYAKLSTPGFGLRGVENRAITRIGKFGSSIATTESGYQVVVGAPEVTVNDGTDDIAKAGKVWVFDRSYQVFTGSGVSGAIFTATQTINQVAKVTIDDIEVFEGIDFTVSGATIAFNIVPRNGARIKVDTNHFNLIQDIENPDPVARAFYGATVAISPNNLNIFVGAPGYRNVNYYNGRVYRYLNQALNFGAISAETSSPNATLGDTIRINDVEVVLTSTGGVTERAVKNLNSKNITGVAARTDGISGLEFLRDENNRPVLGTGYFEANIAAVIDPPDQTEGRQAVISNFLLFANGAINTYQVTDPGSGYTFAPNVAITGANTTTALATVTVSRSPLKIYTTERSKDKRINILPGVGTGLSDLGLKIYKQVQIFEHPDSGTPEKFGTIVKVDSTTGESLLVSSLGGATLKTSTFDNLSTLFDRDTTRFIDVLKNSGAVYVYDYLPIPGETLSEPSQYLYNQVLQNSLILFNDNFGSGIAINNDWVVVGSTRSDYYREDAGAVHLFTNPTLSKGWVKLREREDKVDIDYINQAFLYDQNTQLIVTDLDYFDPVKGKILGVADQDLDYKTAYDPAVYNRTTVPAVTYDTNSSWNEVQVGRTWWNLDTCRYIDYEQGDINYRVTYWGQLFPGSTVEVCEWVESLVLPSQYAATNNGEAKYADDSAYVEQSFYDSQSGLIKTKYYYWVKNKTNIESSYTTRTSSVAAIADFIQDPRGQDIPYVAVVASNAFSLYNVNNYLSASDIILKIEYARTLNENIAHSEYELVQQNNPLSQVPEKYISKLIDSLSGENSVGEVVPDLRLKENNQVGVGVRPRQTMIKNPAKAIQIFVGYLNRFLAENLIVRSKDLTGLQAQEPVPPDAAGFYNQIVNTYDELNYIPVAGLIDGYKVLVLNDGENEGYWTIYEFTEANTPQWSLNRIQSYDSNRYWSYANWYTTGYNDQTQVDYIVQEFKDIATVTSAAEGDVIKVLDDGNGNFELYAIDATLAPVIVGAQNGTIQLNESLYNTDLSLVGFDNTGFDNIGFAKTNAIELRNIIQGMFDGILTNTDSVEINKLFFVLINYILSEQKNVDWLIKTSFVSVVHKIRKLEQFAAYTRDQQDYFEQYINEVKPYRTQVREYLLDYEGLEYAVADSTDFDFPSVYDSITGTYRPLNINVPRDANAIAASSSVNWLNNYKYSVQSIIVIDGGEGYVRAPTVTVSGNGTGATATAIINPAGQVTEIDIVTAGSGYTTTPTVTFTGGGGFGARAYVVLSGSSANVNISTQNKTVRTITTTLSFDRTTYVSKVRMWKPYTTYHPGDIIVVPDVTKTLFANLPDQLLPRYNNVYLAIKTVLGTDTLNLNIFDDETVVQKLRGSDIDNAIDRVAAYHRPGTPDIATLYSSPDTNRLDDSNTNDAVSSQGNEWNAVKHSGVVPATHEYQYIAVGNRGLIALSKNSTNWVVAFISENQINLRDACLFNGTTWIAVGNQATLLTSDDAVDWSKEVVTEYQFSPTIDNTSGSTLLNASQAIDFTAVAEVTGTRGNYVIAAGNGSNILMNPYDTSLDLDQGWYSAKPQPTIYGTPIQFLTLFSQSFGDLTDNNGTTYAVDLQDSGYFTTSGTSNNRLQQGFVIAAGNNGNFFITSYARLEDALLGYAKGYNYDAGKAGDSAYPWIEMKAPIDVIGQGDGVSGQQINAIALSGETDRWLVAVGSAGTLIWNKLDSPVQLRSGAAELGSDTIGKTVVNYGIEVFKNFRAFNADNFISPLSPAAINEINFSDVTWDGEKFVVVGNESTIIWGYPGVQSEAYIELGSINPVLSAGTRTPSADWDAVTGATSLTMLIPSTDLAGEVFVGMTVTASLLPDDSLVTGVSYNAETTLWSIAIAFATATVSAGVNQRVSFSYGFVDDIPSGTTLTFTGPNSASIQLVTSRAASKGDNIVYVDNYTKVLGNWAISGTGMPTGARVKQVGRFANFTWQYARSSGKDVNIDYNSVSVNTTTVQLNTPFTANIPAGALVTFFDTTGTKLQLRTTQFLNKDTYTLAFANTATLGAGYTLEANTTLGILGGVAITSTKSYTIGGVLDHLAKDIPDLVPGTSYPGARVIGQPYTETETDILSLDTQITSVYTDNELGTRPEDITINGGKYIDTFSSHAPEELVPGQVIDSLQMNVFTANVVNGNVDYGNVIAYKAFTDYKLPTVYYRLPAANTVVLTSELSYDSEEVAVDDVAKLPEPNASQNQPGSIWINAEKINYFGIDYGRNVLTDIRRGAARTSIPLAHPVGSIITDASAEQIITRDTVLSITQDLEVNNGFSGNANTVTYQSTIISSVPQGTIWLERP